MLLTIIQGILLVFLAAGAVCVVTTREPLRQTMMISLYGLLLALLFFTFQAPDVSLSDFARRINPSPGAGQLRRNLTALSASCIRPPPGSTPASVV